RWRGLGRRSLRAAAPEGGQRLDVLGGDSYGRVSAVHQRRADVAADVRQPKDVSDLVRGGDVKRIDVGQVFVDEDHPGVVVVETVEGRGGGLEHQRDHRRRRRRFGGGRARSGGGQQGAGRLIPHRQGVGDALRLHRGQRRSAVDDQ